MDDYQENPTWITMWRPKFFKIFKDFKSDNWRITFKSTTSNDVFDGRNWIELSSNRPLGRRKRSQNQNNNLDDVIDQLGALNIKNKQALIKSTKKTTRKFGRLRLGCKLKFNCEDCGNSWTSMAGQVNFWIWFGEIRVEVTRQKCDNCPESDYQTPICYADEVEYVLSIAHKKVGIWFYGAECLESDKKKRSGKMKAPHRSDLCEACERGDCIALRDASD